MEKLFFTTLVAIVAVGGALTVKASGVYENTFGHTVICDLPISLISCASQGPLYLPGYPGEPAALIDLALYYDEYKQN